MACRRPSFLFCKRNRLSTSSRHKRQLSRAHRLRKWPPLSSSRQRTSPARPDHPPPCRPTTSTSGTSSTSSTLPTSSTHLHLEPSVNVSPHHRPSHDHDRGRRLRHHAALDYDDHYLGASDRGGAAAGHECPALGDRCAGAGAVRQAGASAGQGHRCRANGHGPYRRRRDQLERPERGQSGEHGLGERQSRQRGRAVRAALPSSSPT